MQVIQSRDVMKRIIGIDQQVSIDRINILQTIKAFQGRVVGIPRPKFKIAIYFGNIFQTMQINQ